MQAGDGHIVFEILYGGDSLRARNPSISFGVGADLFSSLAGYMDREGTQKIFFAKQK